MEGKENIQKIIITDTHFGVKNNSIKFLESQKRFFSDLCDYMKTCPNSRFDLIHLGDIFDSRSTLSVQVMYEVKYILIRLNTILKRRDERNRFIFVAGNHDFFSPNNDEVNSLDVFLREVLPDALIIDRYCRYEDGNGDMYIPWYQMNDPEKFADWTKYVRDHNLHIKRIFTHCDCHEFQWGKIPAGINVYSGHIHQYKEYPNVLSSGYDTLYNLSTPYSIDFGDSNDNKKGFWTLDGKNLELHQNDKSIKFRTFINDQIFDIPDLEESIERGDNYRIYLTEENRTRLDYIERLNELSTKLRYVNIILTSSDATDISEGVTSGEILNIEEMIREALPEHIRDVFDVVKKELSEKI